MKRSAALAPLSRDHQHALDAALRLRRADDAGVAAAVAHFLDFFAREGRRHFAIEEELLLPALPRDDAEWAPCITRIREDHTAVRAAADAPPEGDATAARALGERLAAHVRFEERTAFEILERRLSDDELERLGAAVDAAERGDGPSG
jgi:hemerythrin-like domain-containing protein